MKITKLKLVILGLMILGIFFGATAFKSKPISKHNDHILRVGTNAEFAPFSFIENGEIQGFDIDMIKAVAKKLNYEIQIIDLPWDALIPELKSRSVDIIAAGMTMTQERAQVVDFTTPYLDGEPLVACFLKGKQDITTVDDIFKHSIVVNDGYTADMYVTKNGQREPIRIQSPIDAMMALTSGRAQVYVLARNVVQPLIDNLKEDYIDSVVIEGTSENCAMMVTKGQSEFLSSINQALEELKEEGVVDALRLKWGV